jgi:hypothetical protein
MQADVDGYYMLSLAEKGFDMLAIQVTEGFKLWPVTEKGCDVLRRILAENGASEQAVASMRIKDRGVFTRTATTPIKRLAELNSTLVLVYGLDPGAIQYLFQVN